MSEKPSITEVNLPTHSIAKDVLDILVEDDYFLPGDKLTPGGELESGPQLTCTQIEVLNTPGYDVRREHPDWKDLGNPDYYLKAKLTLQVEEMDISLIKKVCTVQCFHGRSLVNTI